KPGAERSFHEISSSNAVSPGSNCAPPFVRARKRRNTMLTPAASVRQSESCKIMRKRTPGGIVSRRAVHLLRKSRPPLAVVISCDHDDGEPSDRRPQGPP